MRLRNLMAVCLVLTSAGAQAMSIQWVRMTGRAPVESSPLVVDRNGKRQIVAVNRGGQVMLWSLDGKAVGAGEDGTVADLPKGEWTATPAYVSTPKGPRLIFGSVDGQVVALDGAFKTLWTFKLPGETQWGRDRPVVVDTPGGPELCFGDKSGAITCLDPDGKQLWQVKPGNGPCVAPLQVAMIGGRTVILASAGTSLCCLSTSGALVWKCDLGGTILSQAEVLDLPGRRLIVCGTGTGELCALDEAGHVQWKAPIGDEIDASIAFMPRAGKPPLILCTGLWGNIFGIEPDGRIAWTHLYRAKGRATPVVADANGDGKPEAMVGTYDQRIYVFSARGEVVDTVRVNGGALGSLVPVEDPATPGRTDFLQSASALLMYCLRPGPPVATYGGGGAPTGITIEPRSAPGGVGEPAVVVHNPNGALIAANVGASGLDGRTWIEGCVTSRTAFEIPLPPIPGSQIVHYHVDVRGAGGNPPAPDSGGVHVVQDLEWDARANTPPPPPEPPALRAWATPAYGSFSDRRLVSEPGECVPGEERIVDVPALYRNEAGEGAFVIASTLRAPERVHIRVDQPVRGDGLPFGGTIVVRRVVMVPTIDGEYVGDALPTLSDRGDVTIAPGRSQKIWLSLDAHGAEPGVYRSTIRVEPVGATGAPQELTLSVEVLPLALPTPGPLRLCTWDYVPNKLFPSWTKDALDDMGRHGVNIFPRTTLVPPAKADAEGRLTFDWTSVDTELARLKGRGVLLIQLGWPPIAFASEPSKEARHRAEIAYVRGLRDHLRAHGFAYADWALYPTDEPGGDSGGRVDALVKCAALFREADPRIRIYTDPVPSLPWSDFQRIDRLIDVWCPNMRLVNGLMADDPRIEWIMKSGKPVWSYECVDQVKSLSPLRYDRANAWRALRFGLNGIGFWTHSQTSVDPWLRNEKSGEEYALVYPADRPVPSVRWEAVRDGLEDAGAVALLRERLAKRRRDPAKRALVAQGEQEIALAIADVAQLSDDAFIESRDYLRKGDRRIWHTWTDVALFAHHRARIAALTTALGG